MIKLLPEGKGTVKKISLKDEPNGLFIDLWNRLSDYSFNILSAGAKVFCKCFPVLNLLATVKR